MHFGIHSDHHCPVHAVTLLDARYKNKFFASDEWRVDARKRRSRRSNNLGETYVQVYLGALSQKVKDETNFKTHVHSRHGKIYKLSRANWTILHTF